MLWLLACTVAAPDTGSATAGSDAEDSADDDPAPEDSALADPLDALADCSPESPGDRLDVDAACFDGVCLGQTLEAADDAFGRPSTCLPFGSAALCFWGDGILGSLTDSDGDGTPDSGARIYVLSALDPWDGADPAGLALGLGLGCFVDTLGTPSTLLFSEVEGALVPSAATWTSLHLTVTDQQDRDYAFVPDGRVESIAFQDTIYQ